MHNKESATHLATGPSEFAAATFGGDTSIGSANNFAVVETPRGPLRSGAAESVGAIFFGGFPNWEQSGQIQLIYTDHLVPHPWNPRQWVDRKDMLATTASINAVGIHTPIEICQFGADAERGLVLSGHRRLWVANGLEIGLVPCRLDPRRILNEVEQREVLIRANEGQELPAPIDRAKAILNFMTCFTPPLSQRDVASRLSISPLKVGKLLRYLTLPEPVQLLINQGKLNESVADQLAKGVSDKPGNPERLISIAQSAAESHWPARKVQQLVTGKNKRGPNLGHTHLRPPDAGQGDGGLTSSASDVRSFNFGDGLSVRITSNKTALTPEAVKDAMTETIMQIPISFGKDLLGGAISAPVASEAVENLPRDVSTQPNLPPSPTAVKAAPTQEIPLTDALSDPYGIKAPISYHFPQIRIGDVDVRSAAAESVDAVFIDGYPDWSQCDKVQLIFVNILTPHPWNPRVALSAEAMRNTMLSVKAAGIHTPLLIAQNPAEPDSALILGGHRRTWVALNIGLELVPCRLDPRGVLSEIQVRETLLSDNEGQVRTAPIDRARSYHDYLVALKNQTGDDSLDTAAARIGVATATIRKSLKLLALPVQVQQLINSGALNESQGAALCDHRGGENAIIALATRAVTEGLTAARLRSAAQKSSPDFTQLSGGTNKKSELHFAVGGNRRIHVQVIGQGSLPEGESLARILSEGIQNVSGNFVTAEQAAPSVEPAEQRVTSVLLNSVVSSRSKNAEARIVKSLGKFVEFNGEEHLISSQVAEALNKSFTNAELKKLGLTNLEVTHYHVSKWHRISNNGGSNPGVTLAQVISYWAGSLDALNQLPPTKKYIDEATIQSIPLDTELIRGAPRERIASEIRARLGRIEEVLESRILPMLQAEHSAELWHSQQGFNFTLDLAELKTSGIVGLTQVLHAFNRWRRDHNLPGVATVGEVSYQFVELHRFLVDGVKAVMDLSGMHLNGMVGIKQLRSHCIPFSGSADQSKERFSSRAVFDELNANLTVLNAIAARRN